MFAAVYERDEIYAGTGRPHPRRTPYTVNQADLNTQTNMLGAIAGSSRKRKGNLVAFVYARERGARVGRAGYERPGTAHGEAPT